MAKLLSDYCKRKYMSPMVYGFFDYFNENWVNSEINLWAEFASTNLHYSVSTNNGLENCNRQIKDSNTLRRKLPLAEFLPVAEQIVCQWSVKPEYQVCFGFSCFNKNRCFRHPRLFHLFLEKFGRRPKNCGKKSVLGLK